MVRRILVNGVFGLEQGVGHQLAGMLVREAVKDALPLLAAGDDAGQPQLGEMLGNGGGSLPDGLGDLPDGEFAIPQRQDDTHPRRLGQHREDRHGEFDVLRVGETEEGVICIHMQMITCAGIWVNGVPGLGSFVGGG